MERSVLEALSESDRRELLTRSRRRVFAKGEVVFHRGDPADTMHLVVKGRFVARVVTPLGDTADLTVIEPGGMFGELALIMPGASRSATVAAIDAAETRSIHVIDFDALRRRSPEVTDLLLRDLAEQVRRLSQRLVEALYVPADTRVVRRVCELAAIYAGDGAEATIPLTQEDVAGLAGTSRPTVNRVLREAERAGELRLSRGRIVVLERERLLRRAKFDLA